MSITSGIDSLSSLIARLRRDGKNAVGDVVGQLHEVEKLAKTIALDDLSRLCRIGAESITRLAENDYDSHAPTVLLHLDRLVEFATKCATATAQGGDLGSLVPPPVLMTISSMLSSSAMISALVGSAPDRLRVIMISALAFRPVRPAASAAASEKTR